MVKVGHTHVHGVVGRQTSSGRWVGAGGNRKRPCVLHCSLWLDAQQVLVTLAQDKIWDAYNRGDLRRN